MFPGTGTGARRRTRSSVLKLLALCGVAAGVPLAAAGPASAGIPETLTLHNVVLNTFALGGVAVVKPAGPPLTVNVNVTPTSPTTAVYTVTGWTFPTYSFNSPAPGTITVNPSPGPPPDGTVNFATGAVTMSIDLQADITITGIGSCTVDTGQLGLSTANTQPLLGQAFPPGASGVTSGDGAFGTGWNSLPAPTGSACPVVSADLAGVGGIWISGDVTPPLIKVTHSKIKRLKAHKTESIKVTLANSGNDSSGQEKVCLKVPKGLKGSSCKAVANVAGGKSSVVKFKVKATKKKTKKYTLKLTVTPSATALLGPLGKVTSEKLTLKVKK